MAAEQSWHHVVVASMNTPSKDCCIIVKSLVPIAESSTQSPEMTKVRRVEVSNEL